jgi:hypothetical protein
VNSKKPNLLQSTIRIGELKRLKTHIDLDAIVVLIEVSLMRGLRHEEEDEKEDYDKEWN